MQVQSIDMHAAVIVQSVHCLQMSTLREIGEA